MPATSKCNRWSDGWGRRLGPGKAGHVDKPKSYDYARTYINDKSAVLAGPKAIPARVKPKTDMKDVLIFEATDLNIDPKFEPFSPTVFQPRGSCNMDFPREGEYHIAVWAAKGTVGKKHYSLGLGMAERDVMKFSNTIKFDYMLYDMFMWVHWSPAALLLPLILPVLAVWILFAVIIFKRPQEERPSVFKMVSTTGATIILGHVLWNIINLAWCASVAHTGGEATLTLIMSIFIPAINAIACIVTAFKCKPTDEAKGAKCCCKEAKTCRNVCRRVTVGLIGLWHILVWHSGYIVASIILIIAALLPNKAADYTVSLAKDNETAKTTEITKVSDKPEEDK